MKKHFALLLIFFTALIWSAIRPHDYFTWLLEVFPAVLGLAILITTFRKFEFTFFTYAMILIHCVILFVGGHYTYAEVPLFDWIKETFHQSRNNYDKIGHFAQGFFPAFIVREIFIRKDVVRHSGWQAFLIVCVCLSVSALYEFLEWMVAAVSGQSAEAFLGTQGYVWDTQSDMLYATAGAIIALVIFSRLHNRAIEKLVALRAATGQK